MGRFRPYQANPMDSILQFYRDTRQRFPAILEEADKVHLRLWEVEDEWAIMWFESLAEMLNENMRKGARMDIADMVFDYMRERFATGSKEVQRCIDVSFVENLFWRVPPKHARIYWARMPDLLKKLYLGFHSKPPC
jgi:hypothetical protein